MDMIVLVLMLIDLWPNKYKYTNMSLAHKLLSLILQRSFRYLMLVQNGKVINKVQYPNKVFIKDGNTYCIVAKINQSENKTDIIFYHLEGKDIFFS